MNHIIRDVVREVTANVAMGISPVRAWRLTRPRAGARFHPELLERYAFQALRGVERHTESSPERTSSSSVPATP